MRATLPLLLLLLATGCAAAFGTPGPGASGVNRRTGPSVYVEEVGNSGYGYAYLDPGKVSVGEGGISFVMGFKLGAMHASYGDRDAIPGLVGSPHADLVYIPRSDRWALGVELGWLFQTLDYEDDSVAFNGFSPSARFMLGLRRRLYAYAGAGLAFGNLKVASEANEEGVSAGATQLQALGGFSFVFRRTPQIDLTLRFEGSAFRTGEVMLGGEQGRLDGYALTFEIVLSRH